MISNMINISLTSMPSRCNYLHKVIKSLFNQTIVPNSINLYYQSDNISKDILELQNDIFHIFFVDAKYKSYTKFKYQLEKQKNDCIILCDDDIEYKEKFVENLYNGYLKHNNSIICNSCHKVHYKNNTMIYGTNTYTNEMYDENLKPLSGWGTLIPPNVFGQKNIESIELFLNKCPTDDESWIFANSKINKIKYYCIGKYSRFRDPCISYTVFKNRLVLRNTVDVLKEYSNFTFNWIKENINDT